MNTRNRMKRITILTMAILALAITGTAAGSEITFVLGTDENRASLENASGSVTVNICNATQAMSMNFANESVLFLASLDNETVSWINSTINQSAEVITYNLSTNISIGNVDDVNITKYWVYGGDGNIENLITYMDNKFYGNTTAVDQPKPPEGRAKTAFVVHEKTSYAAWLEKASDDLYISRCLNVSLCSYAADDPESYQGMNLSDQNIIILWMLGPSVQDAIKDMVLEARSKGADVIYIGGGADIYGLSSVNLSSPEFANISTYWANGGIENMRRLLIFTGVKFCAIPIADFGLDEIPPPLETPQYGIYHPDAKDVGDGIHGLGIFSSTDDYLEWYKEAGRYRYNESAPTVGIHYFYASGKGGSYQTLDPLIRMIEDKGANVIFATFASPETDPNTTAYLFKDGEPLVDSLILLKSFRLWYGSEDKGIAYLQDLNVTPIKGIMSSANQSRWEGSNGLSPSEIAYEIALPELDGATEFIILSGNEEDPVSGEYYYKPFDYQLDWITDRTISWAKLHRKDNAEKKIAIIYYNHGGGKDNLGATYLDIIPSLKTLLAEMKEDRYKIEGEVPDEKKLLDLMIKQGRNIGTWAPGELKSMVENGSVVLIPAEEYEGWFNELPANKQQEVIEKWGDPPGEVMVYANETGKYLVIPKLSFGNVLLAPQPTRGWLQNESVLYHDKELAPHHQNIAFYLWLKKEYGADAIVHFGTHGTLEWLPGKETVLSVRECWPAILIQDLPVVYPYIMDNVGEGTQAKRRGNAVIVDHLTPPIVASGLYGNFSLLHEKIHQYLGAEGALKLEYRNTITELYENLSLSEDLGVSVDDLRAMNESDFEYFINGELHLHIHELAEEFIPYGLHILGSPPVDWKLLSMVESMLGEDFTEHIAEVYLGDPHVLHPAHENCTVMEGLLREVIFNGSSPVDAQKQILGPGNVSSNVTADLETAKVYAENLTRCTIEIPRILDGLAGRYVPPKTGNDPIRNPDALPTGNNFHSFDPRLIPTKEAWNVGMVVADSLLSQYREEHNGSYPNKTACILWSIETMRHQGVMESQILYLLGTRPVWDSRGRVKDVELIPSSELNRSRIDVLISTSGLYRDTFPDKVKLLDKAVRLAAQAENDTYPNYVKENSDSIYEWLIANGYNESEARSLSMARVFAMSLGNYGVGLENAIAASNTWESETKLANLFIDRMGYTYGEDGWGVPNIDIFKQNLADVEVAAHSDSSNLFGMLDTDDYFQHLGGLALAVRSITGETPDLYITNLRDPHNPKTETLKSYLRREINARNFNPRWIEGMMEHDYAGAREMMRFTEHLWGWEVVTPDLITDDMWNQVYDVYVQDKYDMGLNDWFDENAPHAYQSMTARMLETVRKGYWDATDEVIESLAKEYVESVAEHGATCCHHTCGNPLLDEFVSGIISPLDAEVFSSETAAEYRKTMDEVAGRTSTSSQPIDTGSGGGGDGTYPPGWFNETEQTIQQAKSPFDSNETTVEGGIGKDITKPVNPSKQSNPSADYVEGQKMEETETFQTSPSSSSAPLLAIIAVIVILALIGVGLRFKRK